MNTFTTLTWGLTKNSDGSRTHTATRSGWTFTVHTPATGPVLLTGKHDRGRTARSTHASTASAKCAALKAMHPAEAMGWVSRPADRVHEAQWDDHRFRCAQGDNGGFEYRSTLRPVAVSVEGVREARVLAARDLEAAYGYADPAQCVPGPVAAVQSLETALRAAGIRFTAKQLAVAAVVLEGQSSPAGV